MSFEFVFVWPVWNIQLAFDRSMIWYEIKLDLVRKLRLFSPKNLRQRGSIQNQQTKFKITESLQKLNQQFLSWKSVYSKYLLLVVLHIKKITSHFTNATHIRVSFTGVFCIIYFTKHLPFFASLLFPYTYSYKPPLNPTMHKISEFLIEWRLPIAHTRYVNNFIRRNFTPEYIKDTSKIHQTLLYSVLRLPLPISLTAISYISPAACLKYKQIRVHLIGWCKNPRYIFAYYIRYSYLRVFPSFSGPAHGFSRI